MRTIRLTGREGAVVRAIGFSLPTPGIEVHEQTGLAHEDLTDAINALLSTGYIESIPFKDQITEQDLEEIELEVNPSYARELRKTMRVGR